MNADGAVAAAAGEIDVTVEGAAAVVTLNRPRALNALTTAMRAQIAAQLPRLARDPQVYCVIVRSACAKAFSAGGDVREIAAWGRQSPDLARNAFREEYALDWALDCFTKPTISLIDGVVMGSGVGISAYGTHRVAGEGYRFAMPETALGLFPDVGAAYLFSRLPGEVGVYLGLTGRSIGRADAYRLGLATHCIPAALFEAIRGELKEAEPVDAVLDSRHVDPGPGEIEPYSDLIDRLFAGSSVERIMERLASVTGPQSVWAEGVLADLKSRAPLSLKVTLRHIRAARALDLRETLQVDYRLACRFLEDHDFYEGVRATLIDKDRAPQWRPARLEDVTDAMVAAYFAPIGVDELALPLRMQMQEIR